ncbi:unnamed protein product, partial [Rotaria magnacalcarata]
MTKIGIHRLNLYPSLIRMIDLLKQIWKRTDIVLYHEILVHKEYIWTNEQQYRETGVDTKQIKRPYDINPQKELERIKKIRKEYERLDPGRSKRTTSSHIHTTFETMISRLYGDVGIACFTRNLSITYYNSSTHVAIVRCLRDDKKMLPTAATFIAKLTNDSVECSILTLHVGGSIRQCQKYLVNYCIEQLLFINSQSINRNQTTSQLFKKKKKKTNTEQKLMDIDHDKQSALQKLLADSRIESTSNIVSKNNDDDDLGKRKRDG